MANNILQRKWFSSLQSSISNPKTEITVSYKMEPCSWTPNPAIPTRILSPQSPPIMLSSPGPQQNEETNTGFSHGRVPPPSPLCASCRLNDNGVRCAPHAYTLAGPRGHKCSLAQDTPSLHLRPNMIINSTPFHSQKCLLSHKKKLESPRAASAPCSFSLPSESHTTQA